MAKCLFCAIATICSHRPWCPFRVIRPPCPKTPPAPLLCDIKLLFFILLESFVMSQTFFGVFCKTNCQIWWDFFNFKTLFIYFGQLWIYSLWWPWGHIEKKNCSVSTFTNAFTNASHKNELCGSKPLAFSWWLDDSSMSLSGYNRPKSIDIHIWPGRRTGTMFKMGISCWAYIGGKTAKIVTFLLLLQFSLSIVYILPLNTLFLLSLRRPWPLTLKWISCFSHIADI